MIIPACDSGLLLDAKGASEKAMNLRSSVLMGCILMWTSLCFFALWSTLLAVIRVATVAEFIWDCKWLKALAMSGLSVHGCILERTYKAAKKVSFLLGHHFIFLASSLLGKLNGWNLVHVFRLGKFDTVVRMLKQFNSSECERFGFLGAKWILLFQLRDLFMKIGISSIDSIIYMYAKCTCDFVGFGMSEYEHTWIKRTRLHSKG